MSVSNELAAINAAIRLGDLVCPPVGAVIFWLVDAKKGGQWRVESYHGTERFRIAVMRNCSSGVKMYWCPFLNDTEFPTIASVPEDAPPFEWWERPV
jgi:hypothetical protein